MKKIFSVLAVLSCFETSYAQDTKPTKQETMDWVISKFTNCLGNGYQDVNENFTLTWKYFFAKREGNVIQIEKISSGSKVDTYWINLDLVTGVVDTENGYFGFSGTVELINLARSNSEKVKMGNLSLSNKIQKSITNNSTIGIDNLINFGCENDLRNRMYKALTTLAAYNKENSPKEKF